MSKDNWPTAHKAQTVLCRGPGGKIGLEWAGIIVDVHEDRLCSVRTFSPSGPAADMKLTAIKYFSHHAAADKYDGPCCFPPRGFE